MMMMMFTATKKKNKKITRDYSFTKLKFISYRHRVSQNSRIPNSERGREDPSELEKYLEKKIRSS
jgi:hypothetical protein